MYNVFNNNSMLSYNTNINTLSTLQYNTLI